MATRTCLSLCFSFLFAAVLSGCATPTLNVHVRASNVLNSDGAGESYSVLVRFYQLSSPEIFEDVTVKALLRQDEGVLGASLLEKKELMISPGMATNLKIPKVDAADFLAVVAFFRDDSSGQQMMLKKVNSGMLPFSTQLQLSLADNKLALSYR